jgi:hypothetical protein
MKTRTVVLLVLVVVFAAAIAYSLRREVRREEATLATSISGVVDLTPQLLASGQADVVRTDRLVLMLVDPQTQRPVALRFVSPLVPPQTIRIGQEDARDGAQLKGAYLVVGITDKDGEIFKITPGEVYGRSPQPVALGSEEYTLLLTEPFRGSLFNEAGAPATVVEGMGRGPYGGGTGGSSGGGMGGGAPAAGPPMQGGPMQGGPMAGGPMAGGPISERAGPLGEPEGDPAFSIAGTITVAKALAGSVEPSDRLIILMFDPQQARPVAFKIIPHTLLPQRFTITLPPDARPGNKDGYSLRILTDKDDNPFGAAPGEVVGRSAKLVPLGTTGLHFQLDSPYTR